MGIFSCGGPDTYRANTPTDYNVVFITLDGVRWQEVVAGADPLLTPSVGAAFPNFWQKVAPRGVFYGDQRHHSQMTVATPANASLPGYMSIFAETDQGCLTNYCDRTTTPTFLDRLHDELGVPRELLVVFASWSKLALAVSGRDDVALVRAGQAPFASELSGHAIGSRALTESALEMDRGPVLAALRHLDERQPRLLYLSLWDSDRFAHQGDYGRYLRVLGEYDRLLVDVVAAFDRTGAHGRKTALVVTTDHGRGLADQWTDHGPQTPSSADVWAFVMLPSESGAFALRSPTERRFDHHDVRYTIETLLGLATKSSSRFSTGFLLGGP